MIWYFHLDDLSDDMNDKSTVAIRDEVMTTYHQPHTYDPRTHVGKLTKWFVPSRLPVDSVNHSIF